MLSAFGGRRRIHAIIDVVTNIYVTRHEVKPYYTLRRNAEEYIAFTRHSSKRVNIARRKFHTIMFVVEF